MIRTLMAALLAGVSLPTLAAEVPKPLSNDGRVCVQAYDRDQVTDVHLDRGREITFEVASTEVVQKVSVSDLAHLLVSVMDGTNIFWMKPTMALPAQPVSIITKREDGSIRTYLAQVDAKEPTPDPQTNLVSVGDTLKPTTTPKPCYLIRYTYPGDDGAKAAAQAKAARQAQAARWLEVKNAALLHEHQVANQNWKYVGKGDTDLAPDRIWDDGYSTFLEYHGNRPIPAPYEVGARKDKLLAGWNSEDGVCPGGTAPSATCLKLHAVLKTIRLRDREDLEGKKPALTIFNRAFNAIGNRPGTGTSSPNVERQVSK
jgi:type IV secretion system protein VirB9